MLQEHREPTPLPLSHRHGGSASPRDMPYSEEDLLRINREHDKKNGWSLGLSTVFTNPMRLPETVIGVIWEDETESENQQ